MLQEPPQELFCRQGHGTTFPVMRVVLPPKGDVIALHREKTMIRDGHSVGVAGQVLQYVLWAAKGRLGIDDPVFPKQSAQEGGECLLIGQRLTLAKEDKLLALKSPP
jgi:hypothetical protein